jgi:hypothetical protein
MAEDGVSCGGSYDLCLNPVMIGYVKAPKKPSEVMGRRDVGIPVFHLSDFKKFTIHANAILAE